MELSYLTPTKTMIVAHLEAGEALGTLSEGTGYIKVDGADPNYAALLEVDPNLETVVDHGEPRLPPAAAAPEPPPEGETGATGATGATAHPAARTVHAAAIAAAQKATTAPKK